MENSRCEPGAFAMSPDEKLYYSERAAIERQRAAESTNPHVIEIHEKLAALYDRLVDTDELHTPRPHFVDATNSSRA